MKTRAFSTPLRYIFSSQRFPLFRKSVAVITSLLLASPPQGDQKRGGDNELVIIPDLHAKRGTGVASSARSCLRMPVGGILDRVTLSLRGSMLAERPRQRSQYLFDRTGLPREQLTKICPLVTADVHAWSDVLSEGIAKRYCRRCGLAAPI